MLDEGEEGKLEGNGGLKDRALADDRNRDSAD